MLLVKAVVVRDEGPRGAVGAVTVPGYAAAEPGLGAALEQPLHLDAVAHLGDGGRWREMAGDGGRWREMVGDGGRWREMVGDGGSM